MDEYYQLQPSNPNSYHFFMYDNFFNHVNFKPENINILDGMAKDWKKECADYEAKIKYYGRIHIFLGGLGPEGHIAFNETGSTRDSLTRKIDLVPSTIEANCRFFNNDKSLVPKHALSVGISTVLDNSDEVIIVVFGKNKNWALTKTLTEKPTPKIPSTFLKTSQNTVVVADYEAIENNYKHKL
ncbi:unnamed protein product [Ambrosiozyma monospora]|uniref:glucosamine-6-phosphate deaminase n=1 Tax=Ambrosiozyma monospora TaxID=43982 RepID=A0A9W6SZZ9_AMBMO|nr:unnamed protein product [Ambrosiozyma monospora]